MENRLVGRIRSEDGFLFSAQFVINLVNFWNDKGQIWFFAYISHFEKYFENF